MPYDDYIPDVSGTTEITSTQPLGAMLGTPQSYSVYDSPQNLDMAEHPFSYDREKFTEIASRAPAEKSWWQNVNTPQVKGDPMSTPFVRALGGLAQITSTGQKVVPSMFAQSSQDAKMRMAQEEHEQRTFNQGIINFEKLSTMDTQDPWVRHSLIQNMKSLMKASGQEVNEELIKDWIKAKDTERAEIIEAAKNIFPNSKASDIIKLLFSAHGREKMMPLLIEQIKQDRADKQQTAFQQFMAGMPSGQQETQPQGQQIVQPAAPQVHTPVSSDITSLTTQAESGNNAGAINTSYRAPGYSGAFGKYQFVQKEGAPVAQNFVNWMSTHPQYESLGKMLQQAGTIAQEGKFAEVWKALATNPNTQALFEEAQALYAKQQYIDPLYKEHPELGQRSLAVQQYAVATSVGVGPGVVQKVLDNSQGKSDEQVMKDLLTARIKASPTEGAFAARQFNKAMEMMGKSQTQTQTQTMTSTPTDISSFAQGNEKKEVEEAQKRVTRAQHQQAYFQRGLALPGLTPQQATNMQTALQKAQGEEKLAQEEISRITGRWEQRAERSESRKFQQDQQTRSQQHSMAERLASERHSEQQQRPSLEEQREYELGAQKANDDIAKQNAKLRAEGKPELPLLEIPVFKNKGEMYKWAEDNKIGPLQDTTKAGADAVKKLDNNRDILRNIQNLMDLTADGITGPLDGRWQNFKVKNGLTGNTKQAVFQQGLDKILNKDIHNFTGATITQADILRKAAELMNEKDKPEVFAAKGTAFFNELVEDQRTRVAELTRRRIYIDPSYSITDAQAARTMPVPGSAKTEQAQPTGAGKAAAQKYK